MNVSPEDIVITDKETNEALLTIEGWSDETKPIDTFRKYILADCSKFVELDTSTMFAWKKSSSTWVQMQ